MLTVGSSSCYPPPRDAEFYAAVRRGFTVRREASRAAARARNAAWATTNREKVRASAAASREAHRAERAADGQVYRQRRRRAMPWLDVALVRDIYKLARIHRAAGIDCHVDHDVPLRGKWVSGLHVQANLTLLLAEHNLAKGNSFGRRS